MVQLRGRLLFNGDLIYPKKGNKPPEVIEGYMADPKDPWVHHRIYRTCKFRDFKNIPTPCGIKKYVYFCELSDSVTNYIECESCENCEE